MKLQPINAHVVVTYDHIGRGARFSARDCPLALAIQDAIPKVYPAVSVGTNTSHIAAIDWDRFPSNDMIMAAELPSTAVDFRTKFDSYGKSMVTPIEFDITFNPIS